MRRDQSLLHRQHGCADQHEQERHAPVGQRQTKKNHTRADDDAQPDHRSNDLHDRAPLCFVERQLIKTLQVEQDRTEYHDRDQQPRVITLFIDALAQAEPERAVIAQHICSP